MRKCRADTRPFLLGLSIGFVLFDGEDVKTWIEFVVRAAVKPSLAAADKTFCAFAILRRLESQGFAFPGKSRSTYTSIGLHYPVPPKPSAAIHGGPPNACVGPRVLYAPENKLRSTQGAHLLEYCA